MHQSTHDVFSTNTTTSAFLGRLRIETHDLHLPTFSAYSEEGIVFWFGISEELSHLELEFSDLSFSSCLFDADLPQTSSEVVELISEFLRKMAERRRLLEMRTAEGFEKALEMYLKAYRLISFIPRMDLPIEPILMQRPGERIGSVHRVHHEWRRHQLMEFLEFVKVHFAERRCMGCLRKIAECCYYLNRLKDGELACRLAIKISSGGDFRKKLGRVFILLAKIYIEMGRIDDASHILLDVLEGEDYTSRIILPDGLGGAANLNFHSTELRMARRLLEKAKAGEELDDGPGYLQEHGRLSPYHDVLGCRIFGQVSWENLPFSTA